VIERLRLRPHVRHEEGAGDRGDREHDRNVVAGPREDERNRCEHRALADAVGRGVEEGAEHGRLPADPRERAVENVEDRADDEDSGAEPVEKELVPALERDEHCRDETQRDPNRRERVRGDARACEAGHRAACEGAGAGRITVLHPVDARGRGFIHRMHADRLEVGEYRNPAMGRL